MDKFIQKCITSYKPYHLFFLLCTNQCLIYIHFQPTLNTLQTLFKLDKYVAFNLNIQI